MKSFFAIIDGSEDVLYLKCLNFFDAIKEDVWNAYMEVLGLKFNRQGVKILISAKEVLYEK